MRFPGDVWLLLLYTGLCQAVYYSALAGAYRHGDMSVGYPLARSLPAVFVLLLSLAMGRSEQISGRAVWGIVIVTLGSVVLPMKDFRDLRFRNYLNLGCGLAVVAAVGTCGYSMIDDEALRLLRSHLTATHKEHSFTTLCYAFFEGLSSCVWLLVLIVWRREGRRDFVRTLNNRKRNSLLTGTGIYLTYCLVLISMGFVRNVSYVVGFRQLSIPLGALMAICVLGESPHRPKLLGVKLMFIGLVLIGTG